LKELNGKVRLLMGMLRDKEQALMASEEKVMEVQEKERATKFDNSELQNGFSKERELHETTKEELERSNQSSQRLINELRSVIEELKGKIETGHEEKEADVRQRNTPEQQPTGYEGKDTDARPWTMHRLASSVKRATSWLPSFLSRNTPEQQPTGEK
jgi:hypothetical protein